ncbi:MAG TPA: pathogenesis-related family 1 protein [Leptospiraceae bacterium]|nr:pathogenesis-related family 1 protein [Leptospiraceae bacterium]HMW05246.1 pathogenesis-related family 1 protein [Leptospiraceae bacterium]HMX31289.1 pathogenesis-related family 1 protein [Leptospiraceae bacterium]HMY32095.1 pathogenesis-related family 1 protein [Leptospiraceae bacterium]HMZ64688.1 pathogenesis-related family 1 protein [Leptospiraceae bacterium]
MKSLLLVFLVFLNFNCMQNIMECPDDTLLLKNECSATKDRKAYSKNMALIGLGISTRGSMALAASAAGESSSVSGITIEHNRLRAQENAGLPNLVWDATVATYALNKVTYLATTNNCVMSHSAGPTNPGYGENLAWASYTSYTGVNAVNAWYNEKSDYNYSTNTCASGKVCGHYTQVVWKNSTAIGCAGVVCSNGGGIIFGCNYNPPGNYSGQKPY